MLYLLAANSLKCSISVYCLFMLHVDLTWGRWQTLCGRCGEGKVWGNLWKCGRLPSPSSERPETPHYHRRHQCISPAHRLTTLRTAGRTDGRPTLWPVHGPEGEGGGPQTHTLYAILTQEVTDEQLFYLSVLRNQETHLQLQVVAGSSSIQRWGTERRHRGQRGGGAWGTDGLQSLFTHRFPSRWILNRENGIYYLFHRFPDHIYSQNVHLKVKDTTFHSIRRLTVGQEGLVVKNAAHSPVRGRWIGLGGQRRRIWIYGLMKVSEHKHKGREKFSHCTRQQSSWPV